MSPIFSEALDAYVDAQATPLEPLLQENHEADLRLAVLAADDRRARCVGRLLRFLVALVRAAARGRDRDLHRLLGAGDGRRPAARRADRHLRALARARRVRPAATSTARRAADRIDVRVGPGARDASTASTAPSTSSSSTPTRRATRLLRGRRAQALAARRDRRRQHAAAAATWSTPVDDARPRAWRPSTTTCRPTSAPRTCCSACATASRSIRLAARRAAALDWLASVRRPLREAPGDPRRRPRPRHADRGRHRQGDARDPPRAARGRRQLQGRQAVHRDRQGALPGRRRARQAQPRPAGRQDRQRGARRADGRRLARA